MTETPAKKAAPVEQPPAVDPLAIQEPPTIPRAFDIGDVVEFTDSIKFQFGAQKTYQRGEVVGIVQGEGMLIVAADMQDSMAYDAPRVEFVFEGRETVMRKVEQD